MNNSDATVANSITDDGNTTKISAKETKPVKYGSLEWRDLACINGGGW